MKFDYIIGNPPYQDEAPGASTSDKPIYHLFMNESYKVSDRVLLITPGRYLFNAGGTPKSWNKLMLEDEHFKVIEYEQDAAKFFDRVTFTGGVAIGYHDCTKKFPPIGVFVPWAELRAIRDSVVKRADFVPFSSIVSGRTPYLFTDRFHKENPTAHERLSKGHDMDISSNAFESLPDVFLSSTNEGIELYRVLGRSENKRAYRWIRKEYARGRDESSVDKWKVFLPKANGASGMLGEQAARLISKPEIGRPGDIATDTFIVVGPFSREAEAAAANKYLLCKFARVLLGTLKVTQINSRETWSNVPLQDFSSLSDIDWAKPIPEIDRQLYKKYKLTKQEVAFIESHVKEMN